MAKTLQHGAKERPGLRDTFAKPLMRQGGAMERDAHRRALLDDATQHAYLSLNTSPFNSACALHGAFGQMSDAGVVFLQNARAVGAELVEEILKSEEPGHRRMRSDLAEVIQMELAVPFLEQRADAFSAMFWNTAEPCLRTQMREHWNGIRHGRQQADAVKKNVSRLARLACASDTSGFLEDLTNNLKEVNRYWMHFYEDPFDIVSGVTVIRGTRIEWPEDAQYTTKLEAMRDPRECFDSIRAAYFLPNRNDAEIVVDCILQIADGRTGAETFKQLTDVILTGYLQAEPTADSWPKELQDKALDAYVRTIRQKTYYFSVGELVWLCRVKKQNVIIAQRLSESYVADSFCLFSH